MMEPDDVVELMDETTCSNFQIEIFSMLKEMKQKGEFCDITIKAGNRSFKAHRTILAAGIPYFNAMFNSNRTECFQKEITIEDVDPDALDYLIDFTYTSKLRISRSKVGSLLQTSMYLQMDYVTDSCLRYLKRELNPDNVFVIRGYGHAANHQGLTQTVDRYVRENFSEVSMSRAFLDQPFLTLKEFISRDDLYVVNEEVVFEGVLKWVNASKEDRSLHLPELLSDVRLHLLEPEYLARCVGTEELIRTSSKCTDMLAAARNYHTKEIAASNSFTAPERYCKGKHHLKCAKVMGSCMYSVSWDSSIPGICIHYHDHINKTWRRLGEYHTSMDELICYMFCTEEKIYLISESQVLSLDLTTLEWSYSELECDIPDDAGIAYHQQKIYFFGSLLNLSDVHCFDFHRGTCISAGRMVKKREFLGTASLGEHIFVTGGRDYGDMVTRSAEKYNAITRTSVAIAPMRIRRCGHGSTALNGKVYVYGGCTKVDPSISITSSCEVYDPLTNAWTTLKRRITSSCSVSLLPYDSKLFSISSDLPKDNFHFEVYHPASNKWYNGDPVPCSAPHAHLATLVTASAWSFVHLPFLEGDEDSDDGGDEDIDDGGDEDFDDAGGEDFDDVGDNE